jgi:hypothetical protein
MYTLRIESNVLYFIFKDGINSYSCSCLAGYTGTNCDIDINECLPNLCMNGATCRVRRSYNAAHTQYHNHYFFSQDLLNRYECSCAPGWEGTHCEINHDDCTPNPCLNGATCSVRILITETFLSKSYYCTFLLTTGSCERIQMQLYWWLHRTQMWGGYQRVRQSAVRKWRHLLRKRQIITLSSSYPSWLFLCQLMLICRIWWMRIAVYALRGTLVPTVRLTEMTVLPRPAWMEPLARWVNKAWYLSSFSPHGCNLWYY